MLKNLLFITYYIYKTMFGLFNIGKKIEQVVDFLKNVAISIAGISNKIEELTNQIKTLKQEIESLKNLPKQND